MTHPSAAPDNHLLMVWSPGPVNGGYTVHQPAVDGGLYLIKNSAAIDEPGEMLLIKNDPKYNEQWPRALVPYKRIHGIDEPKKLPTLANDGTLSKHLPAGTPFGLVGTASFYKRESYPNGLVKPGTVTAAFAGGADATGFQDLDPFNTTVDGVSLNWFNQGADAGRYTNADIHAVRIIITEPTTDRHQGPKSGVARSAATRTSASCASTWVKSRSASLPEMARSRPIPTATRTRASWRRSPPTTRSRSRRSTATAWC